MGQRMRNENTLINQLLKSSMKNIFILMRAVDEFEKHDMILISSEQYNGICYLTFKMDIGMKYISNDSLKFNRDIIDICDDFNIKNIHYVFV